MAGSETLLKIEELKVHLAAEDRVYPVIDGLSLEICRSQIVALVGSSGAGKTLAGLSILGLLPSAARVAGGRIIFEGQDLLRISKERLREVRGKEIGVVFQEPLSALNPLFTVGFQIVEVLQFHTDLNPGQIKARILELLDLTGIPEPRQTAGDYPHQLSAGMRQRAMIAQAIAAEPKLLIADEPTSNLDVVLQAQIMELFRDLKNRLKISTLLITHDLAMVAHLADKAAVLFEGKIVEFKDTRRLLNSPEHTFSKQLVEAVGT